jgi:hypothetical protein
MRSEVHRRVLTPSLGRPAEHKAFGVLPAGPAGSVKAVAAIRVAAEGEWRVDAGRKAEPSCHGISSSPRTPGTGSLAGDTIQEQTRQALTNCVAILQAGGASMDDVIEVGVLLTNPADFASLNEEYARWFPSEPPARYVATRRLRSRRF